MPNQQLERRTFAVVRYLWAAPATCLGGLLALVGIAAGGRIALRDGVIEAEGRLLRWGLTRLTLLQHGVLAITFGHVVLGRDGESLEQTRSHERVHVHQYEHWGPLFIPLYLAASAWAAARGKDPYSDNPFEREAREACEPMLAGPARFVHVLRERSPAGTRAIRNPSRVRSGSISSRRTYEKSPG